jgi:hypothetical protein
MRHEPHIRSKLRAVCIVCGDQFHPEKCNLPESLFWLEQVSPGQICKSGRWRNQKSPDGNGTLTVIPQSEADPLEVLLNTLPDVIPQLSCHGATCFTLHLDIDDGEIENFHFSPRQLLSLGTADVHLTFTFWGNRNT